MVKSPFKKHKTEKIIDFNEIARKDYSDIELAIVANTDPQELKKLTGLEWIQSLWASVDKMMKELPKDAPPIVRLVAPCLTKIMAEAVFAFYLILRAIYQFIENNSGKNCCQ